MKHIRLTFLLLNGFIIIFLMFFVSTHMIIMAKNDENRDFRDPAQVTWMDSMWLTYSVDIELTNKFGLYQGNGKIKAIVIGPNNEKYISCTKILPRYGNKPLAPHPFVTFSFPDNFRSDDIYRCHPRETNGTYRYYFVVDGKPVYEQHKQPFKFMIAENTRKNTINKIVEIIDLR